jgi:hypothetical protein
VNEAAAPKEKALRADGGRNRGWRKGVSANNLKYLKFYNILVRGKSITHKFTYKDFATRNGTIAKSRFASRNLSGCSAFGLFQTEFPYSMEQRIFSAKQGKDGSANASVADRGPRRPMPACGGIADIDLVCAHVAF